MKQTKNTVLKFKPEINSDIPVQYTCAEMVSSGPAGFWKNVNKVFDSVIFKDHSGNLTHFDITYGLVKPFDVDVWATDSFVYQPHTKCLKISVESNNTNIKHCNKSNGHGK